MSACQDVMFSIDGLQIAPPPTLSAPPSRKGKGKREKPHVSNNSGNIEWYTPAVYVEAVRDVLGEIDLDPASCARANETVRAKKFYSLENDAFQHVWRGRVFMNPPYANGLIGRFTAKLVDHWLSGDITEAIVLVNNATETTWFQEMQPNSDATCFPRGRISYDTPEGAHRGKPLQGQAFLYFGSNAEWFRRVFGKFGFVV